ncbi:hypothetical protein PENTCL1PPCAC_10714, partial [Pristionchus entomophagus]
QLYQIREKFQHTLAVREHEASTFIEQAAEVIKGQSLLRPISQVDVERVLERVRRRIAKCTIDLKQDTCEMLMSLKNKLCDNRRKRRNFSKQATEILNDYFEKKMSHPYPTEDEKEQLAKQCKITVAQVSNWFGNKRIRYKKNI